DFPEDLELPMYMFMYMSFMGSGSTVFVVADTVDGELVEYVYDIENGADYITIDTTTMRVDVAALTVTNDGGDSTYTISGSITPGTIDLVAGIPFQMPFLENDFGPDPNENESLYFQFFEDGTGYEIYDGFYDDYYGYYEYSDTSEFEWSATDDSISLFFSYYDYSGYEESDTISLAYNVANDTLTFEAELDFCEMMGDDYYYYYYDSLNCYDMFEMQFGITDIQDITLDFWMEMSYSGPLAIAGEIGLQPGQFKLFQAYPNPFNPTTTLQYEMGSAGPVSIDVFDVNGRKIRSLYNGIQIPGQHEVRWDAKNDNGRSMSSGVYLFKVNVNGKTHTAKTLLLK
ncbi:MAG TPA: T9SS type A sorting domain-containing protein, partial [Candidatus Marinimicrobia bacterium]|nr:T9SS type A sorting domain-containing protein [Candidatus Neomarinimicrobiota bacterium]